MKEYKMIGFLNMFNIVPDFVYPVFQNRGIYYFQDGSNDKINDFVPVKASAYSMIKKCNEYKEVTGVSDVILTVDSKPIYAFQSERNIMVCGESKFILDFFKDYSTDNDVLNEEIEDLKNELVNSANYKKNRERKLATKTQYTRAICKFYATGRKRNANARVYLQPGTGKIIINKRDIDEYLGVEALKVAVRQPLVITETVDKFDVLVNVKGGGYAGQAEAIRLGIARALLQVDTEYRPILKESGFFKREPHMKERKKYGLKVARHTPHLIKK